jgi:TRAP-type transport system periplasmic protein
MMKKGLVLFVSLCVIVTLGTFSASPALAKVIQITVSDHNPEMAPPAKALGLFVKKFNELAAGKAKMTLHYGGALLKGNEAYRGVQKGVVDAAHYVLDRRDGFYLNDVVSLPFLGWPSQPETAKMYKALRDKFPEMRAEWKGVYPLLFNMMPPSHIHNTKRDVKTPADMKGLKLHCAEASTTISSKAAGATPVHTDIADMYMSLDRGLLDGVVNHFPVLFVFGALKLLTHHTIFGDGGINMIPMGVIFNQKKWDKYPADVKKMIEEATHTYTKAFYAMDMGFQKKTIADSKGWGHSFTYLTPEEIKVWYDLVKGKIHDKWIKDAEAKGLPGKVIYQEALNMIK